jgi:hypothetical protein
LPGILYLGDVPVEASYHGSALLHRLLEDWPAQKLLCVEPGFSISQDSRRLPHAVYRKLQFGIPRLLHSRLAREYGTFILATARRRCRTLKKIVGDFRVDAVLTVTHGYSWITAAAFAAEQGLPLHLICHDDWIAAVPIVSAMRPLAAKWFGEYFRQAASRLCVSPFMAQEYEREYGVEGTVVYPSRASDCPQYSAPPSRLAGPLSRPTFAFAGTINGAGYVRGLRNVALALSRINGCLLIYGPTTQREGECLGLNLPNVEFRGLIKSRELIATLRHEADALYVPMSFDACDRRNMELSFPSKLADYTTTGLPLLIQGPSYCSAARWAKENPGIAEVVESETLLAEAVTRLGSDAALRWQLGTNALQVGRACFDYSLAQLAFRKALSLTKSG